MSDEMEITELPPSLASVYIMLRSSEKTSLCQSYSQTYLLPKQNLRNCPEHQPLALQDPYNKYGLPLIFPKLSVSQVPSYSRTLSTTIFVFYHAMSIRRAYCSY